LPVARKGADRSLAIAKAAWLWADVRKLIEARSVVAIVSLVIVRLRVGCRVRSMDQLQPH
jgi:hypothetical protein